MKGKFNKKELQERYKRFTISVFNILDKLPKTSAGNVITYQLLRSSSSASANYRSACRAKSKRDFINKLKTVEEETDESLFWLEIIDELKMGKENDISYLSTECNELLSIITTSLKTLRNQSPIRNS
jgi:four helix bundle protein